jgi:hypothetical protein
MTRINSSLDKFKGKRLNYKRLTSNPPAQLNEIINFNHPYKTKTGNNIMNKSIRKPLNYKGFNGIKIEQLNENEGYEMNNKQALKLGALKILNERESPGFIMPSVKRILEFKNPASKTENNTAKEASNIK